MTGALSVPQVAGAQRSDQSAVTAPLRVRVAEAEGESPASIVVPPSLVAKAADVSPARTLTLQGPAGVRTTAAGGTSIGALLTALGVPVEGLTRIELQVGTGRIVTITGDEVRDGFGGDPACPACKATLDATSRADGVGFVRPLRSGADDNASDELVPRKGQTLYVKIFSERTEQLVTPTTLNDRRKVRVGEPATFRLQARGDAQPAITWFYGDGTVAEGGLTTTHTFTGPGTWPVSAIARTDGRFQALTFPVFVYGKARERQEREPAATPSPTPTPAPTGVPRGAGTGTGPVSPRAPLRQPPAPLLRRPPRRRS